MTLNVDLSLPQEFDDEVRLFPLPNLILFPGVMQGLHIFEPRYRELMEDALATDMLITMACLKPPESAFGGDGEPEIFQTVCVGKIVTNSQTEDGRYNLLLVGAKRASIVQELETEKPYRMAEVEILEDVQDAAPAQLAELRKQLISEFMVYASTRQGLGEETLKNMLVDSMPLGLLVDLVCYAVGLEPADQMLVLETAEVGRRCELVLALLREKMARQVSDNAQDENSDRQFPPDFSLN